MFTPEERSQIRGSLIDAARADPRITGAALTGSASSGAEDNWSDIDLAFGVSEFELPAALGDFSRLMYQSHGALHHLDVHHGNWIYRVFLLPNTLQVDLAFAPKAEFGARAATFQLLFGTAAPPLQTQPPQPRALIGWGWLYALHARSSIARNKVWQAEYMISGIRDQVLALAAIRHGLPAHEGRGIDRLPDAVKRPIEDALVRSLEIDELRRAFRAAVAGLLSEAAFVDDELAGRLGPALTEMQRTLSGR